ncbi:MAG: hypothetical protein RLZZ428_620 [Pseudomonadota bacterium]
MKHITKLALAALLGTALLTSTVSADAKAGQRTYLKKLKAPCGFNGVKFAAKHTQDEWEAIKEGGKMMEEIQTICPKAKELKEKDVNAIYDFSYEYASDSGNVPSC